MAFSVVGVVERFHEVGRRLVVGEVLADALEALLQINIILAAPERKVVECPEP